MKTILNTYTNLKQDGLVSDSYPINKSNRSQTESFIDHNLMH